MQTAVLFIPEDELRRYISSFPWHNPKALETLDEYEWIASLGGAPGHVTLFDESIKSQGDLCPEAKELADLVRKLLRERNKLYALAAWLHTELEECDYILTHGYKRGLIVLDAI